MAKGTTTDHQHSGRHSAQHPGEHVGEDDRGYRVRAADKKVAKKKVAKKKVGRKTSKKKADASKKKSKARDEAAPPASPVDAVAPQAPVTPAPMPEPAAAPPPVEEEAAGSMRGIVALWGPLAIIVLLIIVSRVGEEEPRAPGVAASLESAEGFAREVVEDVQDALTGGDPQAATSLETRAVGQGGSSSISSDLAAARAVVVTVPDPDTVRQIIERVRGRAPGTTIVARAPL